MSIYVNEQRDLELMARLVDEIDECTMHSLFYKDVLRSEKRILRTEKTYIKEYMKSLKLIRPLGFIVTALFALIFFGIYSIGKGELLQLETIWEMIADIQAAFSTFIKGIKLDMSNIADFESAFGAVCDSLEGAYIGENRARDMLIRQEFGENRVKVMLMLRAFGETDELCYSVRFKNIIERTVYKSDFKF